LPHWRSARPRRRRSVSHPRRTSALHRNQKKGGLAKQDQQYFRDLAQANVAEVEAGKLAQQQASSEEVKEYGEQMVEDQR
jgi:predicted outer membrane protein